MPLAVDVGDVTDSAWISDAGRLPRVRVRTARRRRRIGIRRGGSVAYDYCDPFDDDCDEDALYLDDAGWGWNPIKAISRAAQSVAHTVTSAVGGATRTVGGGLSALSSIPGMGAALAAQAAEKAKQAGKAIGRVAPMVAQFARPIANVASSVGSRLTYAMPQVRAAFGAVNAITKGENPLTGAARAAFGDAVGRAAFDGARALASGQRIDRAMVGAVKGAIGDVREQARVAQILAPFVPGIGSGVAAALAAGNALANGESINDATIAAARAAVPGGPLAVAAFDAGVVVAKGGSATDAALAAARNAVPGGKAGQAAFDAALALARGQSIQQAAIAAAGTVLPPSPFTASALDFATRVMRGENVQKAALTTAGNAVLEEIVKRTGPIGAALGSPEGQRLLAAGKRVASGENIGDVAKSEALAELARHVPPALLDNPAAQRAYQIAKRVAAGENVGDVAKSEALAELARQIPPGVLRDPTAQRALSIGRELASGGSVADVARREAFNAIGGRSMRALSMANPLGRLGNGLAGTSGASLLPSTVGQVANAVLRDPSLRSLGYEAIAARLGVSPSAARSAVASIAQGARRVGTRRIGGLPSLAMARNLEDKIPGNISVDRVLARFGSAEAPIASSPNVQRMAQTAIGMFPAFGAGDAGWFARGLRVHTPSAHVVKHLIRFAPAVTRMSPTMIRAMMIHDAQGLTSDGNGYVVESGNNPSQIAKKFTGNDRRYPELMDANPGKPTVGNRSNPYGTGYNFKSLVVGEVLALPESWKPSKPAPSPSSPPITTTLPDGTIVQVKAMLVAWGARTKALSPADYGQGMHYLDLDARVDERFLSALRSYQVWANSKGESLRTDGKLDQPTYDSLSSYTKASAAASTPPVSPVPTTPAPAPSPAPPPLIAGIPVLYTPPPTGAAPGGYWPTTPLGPGPTSSKDLVLDKPKAPSGSASAGSSAVPLLALAGLAMAVM